MGTRVLFSIISFFIASNVFAGVNEDIATMLQNSQAILQGPKNTDGLNLDNLNIDMSKFQNVEDANFDFNNVKFEKPTKQPNHKASKEKRAFLFISFGDKPIQQIDKTSKFISDAMKLFPEVTFVTRGFPKGGSSLNDLIKFQQKIAENIGTSFPLEINPVLFRKFQITASPTLVVAKGGDTLLGKVAGVGDVNWLLDKIEQNGPGDFKVQGEIQPIVERDLIEEIKERIAKIDWEQKKKAAKKRYWKNHKFCELPKAKELAKRKIVPEYEISEDIKAPNGKIVAKSGSKINLLKYIRPTFCLVIFDGTSEKERKIAKAVSEKFSHKRIKYITTKIPVKNGGWKDYESLNAFFGTSVYLLNDNIRESFEIQKTVSLVYAEDDHFIVEEYSSNDVVGSRN